MRAAGYLFVFLFGLIFLIGCRPDEPLIIPEDVDINLGGATTFKGAFVNIFDQPAPNLSKAEQAMHFRSDVLFGDKFVSAPSDINPGLGPIFNQNSCENCHVANGRSPFPQDQNDMRGLLFRLSMPGQDVNNAPVPINGFGKQLQTRAIFNTVPEAQISWQQIEDIKSYTDGESYSLRHFDFQVVNPYTTLPDGYLISPRIAPPVIGLGLLEAIPEEGILANADPEDKNEDGISGRPNYVWNYRTNRRELGRFGWKANEPTLIQQVAGAYKGDMGVTSPYFQTESSYGQPQFDGREDDPEIDEETLDLTTFYTQSLAVPQRRNWDNPQVKHGKALFFKLNCSSCHVPAFVTSNTAKYDFLRDQKIFPYTDLLLHDMGPDLADYRPDFEASGSEWRTPPLWALGLVKVIGGPEAGYLHDGRARTIAEAILWHGGEAEKSKESFRTLDKADRSALISFLESL